MKKIAEEEILPIGSVVLLEGGTKKLMIIGHLSINGEKKGKVYDYMGVLYPEGFLGEGTACMFDHDKITEVFFRGYENEENESFKKVINKVREATDQALQGQSE